MQSTWRVIDSANFLTLRLRIICSSPNFHSSLRVSSRSRWLRRTHRWYRLGWRYWSTWRTGRSVTIWPQWWRWFRRRGRSVRADRFGWRSVCRTSRCCSTWLWHLRRWNGSWPRWHQNGWGAIRCNVIEVVINRWHINCQNADINISSPPWLRRPM